jgi:hypothetical protein
MSEFIIQINYIKFPNNILLVSIVFTYSPEDNSVK